MTSSDNFAIYSIMWLIENYDVVNHLRYKCAHINYDFFFKINSSSLLFNKQNLQKLI